MLKKKKKVLTKKQKQKNGQKSIQVHMPCIKCIDKPKKKVYWDGKLQVQYDFLKRETDRQTDRQTDREQSKPTILPRVCVACLLVESY